MPGAGIQLKIEPFGFPNAERILTDVIRRAGSLRVPFEAAGAYLLTRTHEHFEHEESPDGEPWQALSRKYVDAPKRPNYKGGRGGQAHPILVRSGHLMGSITYAAGDRELAVGTNRKFKGGKSAAAIHQLGGLAGRNHAAHIPARPFLGMNHADDARIGEILGEYLARL